MQSTSLVSGHSAAYVKVHERSCDDTRSHLSRLWIPRPAGMQPVCEVGPEKTIGHA